MIWTTRYVAKLRFFSDFKLHGPVYADGSDLLYVGSEKSNYDWLVTPPGTPLFPFLDDEESRATQFLSRGRPEVHASVSTCFSTEKERRTRSSASPRRSTPGRGRSPSKRNSSPASITNPGTPLRRSATPSYKQAMHRRSSSGSSSTTASVGRPAAFSMRSETPHTLRDSLSSWSAARGRDSSPSSKTVHRGRLNSRRGSFTSRSVGSSQSNDHDHFSSMSKGSVTSSCDDDADSALPLSMRISSQPTIRKIENSAGVRNTRSSSSTYPQKMDQGKVPHHKFRPLLTNAPRDLDNKKSIITDHAFASWNSSLQTSSNPSFERAASTEKKCEVSGIDRRELAVNKSGKVESEIGVEVNMGTQDSGNKPDRLQDKPVFVEDKLDRKMSGHVGINHSEPYQLEFGIQTVEELSCTGKVEKKLAVCQKCNVVFQPSKISNETVPFCPRCCIEIGKGLTDSEQCVRSLGIVSQGFQGFGYLQRNQSTSDRCHTLQLGHDASHMSETRCRNSNEEQKKSWESNRCDLNSSSARFTTPSGVEQSDGLCNMVDTSNSQRTEHSTKNVSCPARKRDVMKKTPNNSVSQRMVHISSKLADTSQTQEETNIIDGNNDGNGKSTIVVNGQGRHSKSMSLTLDEAADRKLFNNVHEAVAVETENEKLSSSSPPAVSVDRPPISQPRKSSCDDGDQIQVKRNVSQSASSDVRSKPQEVASKCKCTVM
ncbi:uncharacterized protein LOC144704109 isoform X2 [Wolffia australiana]